MAGVVVPILAAAVGLSLATAAAGAQELRLPKAEVQHDPEAAFSAFKTFKWRATQDRLPNVSRHMALTAAIEDELQNKGLAKVTEGDADLQVRFYASVDRRVSGVANQGDSFWPGDVRTTVDFEKLSEGTLVIELYAADERRVWRGMTTRVFREKSLSEYDLRSVVQLILRQYPPKPARAGNASRLELGAFRWTRRRRRA